MTDQQEMMFTLKLNLGVEHPCSFLLMSLYASLCSRYVIRRVVLVPNATSDYRRAIGVDIKLTTGASSEVSSRCPEVWTTSKSFCQPQAWEVGQDQTWVCD